MQFLSSICLLNGSWPLKVSRVFNDSIKIRLEPNGVGLGSLTIEHIRNNSYAHLKECSLSCRTGCSELNVIKQMEGTTLWYVKVVGRDGSRTIYDYCFYYNNVMLMDILVCLVDQMVSQANVLFTKLIHL